MTPQGFRLNQVLEHMQRQEEQKQLELRALSEEERRLREQLESLREKQQQQIHALSDRNRRGAINAAELDAALVYLDGLAEAIVRQLGVVSSCEARIDERREELVALLQEKQSLETLKRKQEVAARRETDQREAKTVDDITSARFARRQRGA